MARCSFQVYFCLIFIFYFYYYFFLPFVPLHLAHSVSACSLTFEGAERGYCVPVPPRTCLVIVVVLSCCRISFCLRGHKCY